MIFLPCLCKTSHYLKDQDWLDSGSYKNFKNMDIISQMKIIFIIKESINKSTIKWSENHKLSLLQKSLKLE